MSLDEADDEDEETGVAYTIRIFPALMDRLSDDACRYVFAHEFAHVASKLRFGSITVAGKRCTRVAGDLYQEAPSKIEHEDKADQIALEGFDRELQAFLREDSGFEE